MLRNSYLFRVTNVSFYIWRANVAGFLRKCADFCIDKDIFRILFAQVASGNKQVIQISNHSK